VVTPQSQLLRRLLRRAHLFDDPAAYEAGVRDALELIDRELLDPGVVGIDGGALPGDEPGAVAEADRRAAMVSSA
jgi:hypothetical protein